MEHLKTGGSVRFLCIRTGRSRSSRDFCGFDRGSSPIQGFPKATSTGPFASQWVKQNSTVEEVHGPLRNVRDYHFDGNIGTTFKQGYGANDDKLGKIEDVIFDHATGTVQYAVVDTGELVGTPKSFWCRPTTSVLMAKTKRILSLTPAKKQIESLHSTR